MPRTCRVSTTSLIAGKCVVGNRGLGVLGSTVPSTGTHGASYLYNDLTLPADNNKEIRGLIVTPPAAGTFFAYEDGSIDFTAPDGSYTFVYRLYVDGVDGGTATANIVIGGGALSGNVDLGALGAAGNMAAAGASALSGGATLGELGASGGFRSSGGGGMFVKTGGFYIPIVGVSIKSGGGYG